MSSVGLRAAAVRPPEERGLVDDGLQLVGVERGGDERHVGMARRQVFAGRGEPVEPGRVDLAGDDLRSTEQVDQERLVGRAAAHQHGHLGERPMQPAEGLVAITAEGDDLGDHRVVLRWDHIAFADAGVDPDAGADGQRQRLDDARGRSEPALRVLGVEARFDRVAERRRCITFESSPAGDVDLELHEVESGGQLGDRMFDLQPSVHLEERERPLLRLVQELHRAGVLVPGGGRQPDGRRRAGRDPVRR